MRSWQFVCMLWVFARASINCNNHHLLFCGTFILKTVGKFGQRLHLVHVAKVVTCSRTRMLCAPYCNVCRVGIVYSVVCKVRILRPHRKVNDFQITYIQWDQLVFGANIEVMIKESNLIFHMHKQRSLLLRCCDTNWHFSYVTKWMKSNFFWPRNCHNFFQSSTAGLCKLCRNMRWMFGICKVWQVLCVRVAFPPVFNNFLEAVGDKLMNTSARILRNSMLLLTDQAS